jgi:hypothetical protein
MLHVRLARSDPHIRLKECADARAAHSKYAATARRQPFGPPDVVVEYAQNERPKMLHVFTPVLSDIKRGEVPCQ